MSGATILSRTAPSEDGVGPIRTGRSSACLFVADRASPSTSSPRSAYQSVSRGSSTPGTCSMNWENSSSSMARQSISGPTMAPNLSPRRCANGWPGSVFRPSISVRRNVAEGRVSRRTAARGVRPVKQTLRGSVCRVERLLRELQWQAQGRVSSARNLLRSA